MKRNFAKLILITILFTFLASCGNDQIPVVTTTTDISTISPTVTPTKDLILPTYTFKALPSPTQFPQSSQPLGSCIIPVYECSVIYDLHYSGGPFTISPNNNLWLIWEEGHSQTTLKVGLLNILPSGDMVKMPIDFGVTDILATNSDVWFLSMAFPPSPSMIHRLSIDKQTFSEYEIPQKMLVDQNLNFDITNLCCLHLGAKGELLVSGTSNVWKFIDPNGEVNPQLLSGFPCGQSHCIIQNPGPNQKDASIWIDAKQVILTTDMDGIYLTMLYLSPQGDFFVFAQEITNGSDFASTIRRYSIRHYDLSGKLLGYALVKTPFNAVDANENVYNIVSDTARTQILKVNLAR